MVRSALPGNCLKDAVDYTLVQFGGVRAASCSNGIVSAAACDQWIGADAAAGKVFAG
jgi:hypothetical protein